MMRGGLVSMWSCKVLLLLLLLLQHIHGGATSDSQIEIIMTMSFSSNPSTFAASGEFVDTRRSLAGDPSPAGFTDNTNYKKQVCKGKGNREKWAMLIADAQFQLTQNTEMKLFMEALLRNGLLLINPPARVHHATPQCADFREHIVDQLMSQRHLATNTVLEILRWNRNNGASIVGSMELKAARIQAMAYLRLEAGALEYNVYYDPFDNWEAVRSRITLQDFESDSDESSGQNFYCSSFPVMNPINILAWNVRGAGSAEFRRAFSDLIGRHKPNVVLLTETRVGGDRAESIIHSLGFPCYFKVDPMGYAGGLWLLWNNEQINMHIEGHIFQEIHAIAEVSTTIRVLFSFVYGSPVRERRKFLWENLRNVAPLVNFPWLVCGDFNDVLSSSEKWGTREACRARIIDFRNCINACRLSDLGYSGPKFTWVNK